MSSCDHIRKSVRSLVILPNIIAQCLFPRSDGSSKGLRLEERSPCPQESDANGLQGLYQATIDKLPDDVLLDIFDFYLDNDNSACERRNADEWFTLVHVCRRWRNVVFASPRRLNLALHCRAKTQVRAMLDIWPALPMEIEHDWWGTSEAWPDNIIAALEHRDRVRSINLLDIPEFLWETLAAVMQTPFPELACLRIFCHGSILVLPDSFLGGSAPRLRTLRLSGVRYPGVRNLLLSASDLVDLDLWNVPYFDSEYISPESMVSSLSSLNRLETFHLGFQSNQYPPRSPSPPPQTRVVLPALSYFSFQGVIEYSEALVARIDTPKLSRLYMSFFKPVVPDIPCFRQFISRAKALKPYEAAKVVFDELAIRLELDQPHGSTQLSPFFSLIKQLYLITIFLRIRRQRVDPLESIQFLELFQQFTTIQSLYVSERLVPLIAPALRELVGERATKVLPNLRDIFLGGSVISGTIQGAIQPLLAARQLSNQPIAVHLWEERSAELFD
ncbi:hypothetical protein BC826DRAFT_1152291 [Russula brevipes]|nr:hypothetical protein BC826DRAFT_1152291 [Russula brevipes]